MIPTVSVVLPNYNHARFLPQRLESILSQTFHHFELIVLDDCSSDNSRAILESYAARAPMRLLLNSENSGSPFSQWQSGATASKGKYLWIAESDDYAAPSFLERMVSVLDQDPTIGLVYCQSNQVDAAGVTHGTCAPWNSSLHPSRWLHDFRNTGSDEIVRYLIVHNTIPNASAVVVRRDLFQAAVAGAEKRRLSGDWWTWVRILFRSDIAFVSEALNYYRMHDQTVRSTTRFQIECAEEFALKAYICGQVSIPGWVRARAFHRPYSSWRNAIRHEGGLRDRAWLAATRRDAMTVFPLGMVFMAASLARIRMERLLLRHFI